MSVARLCGVASCGSAVPTTRPCRKHRDAVGDREHLTQLVGDEHDRLALVDEAADDAEELVDLARREHRGRLVEDEDVGVAVERFDQFDPLLFADREILHFGVGVDVEAVLRPELADAVAGRVEVEADALARPRSRARCSRPR